HERVRGIMCNTVNQHCNKCSAPKSDEVTIPLAPSVYRSQLPDDPEEFGHQCARAIDDVIRFATSGDVAAFIAQPVMGEGGILVPPPNYFREVKRILDQHGILFIADEVQSGFAPCGTMFA